MKTNHIFMNSLIALAATSAVLLSGTAHADAARGKEIYDTTCSLCHGMKGTGDGPAGAALNPPAKNFTESKPTNERIVEVLNNGIEGTAMVPYAHLSDDEKESVADYIQTLIPKD